MTRAPRIDTVRNRADATRQLLGTIIDELDDLHVLAYDRVTAARELAVKGGERDWALDTHGDPRARAAYRQLAESTIGACTNLAEASHNAIALLRASNPGDTPRTRRIIATDELIEALCAQARRDERHDYTPHRAQPQPEIDGVKHTLDRIIRERNEAIARADKLEKRLAQYEPVTSRRQRRRRRSA